MGHIRTIATDRSFFEHVIGGLSYPVRGAALATVVALTLSHFASLLPFIGIIANFLVWMATWRYAADCLLHTAHGYAQPPDVSVEINSAQGWSLTLLHVFSFALCVICAVFAPHALWVLLPLLIFILPSIDMALAFGDGLLSALNPLQWVAVIGRFGAAYFIPVGINLLLSVLMLLDNSWSTQLPHLLSIPVSAFVATYLIILGFHLMGVMIHQRHEDFGIRPEAHELITLTGQDDDSILLKQVADLETTDPNAAIALLVDRMQDRHAPVAFHQAYQKLLQRQGHREALLEHGHLWIAALMVDGNTRRALGVLQTCSEIDPQFMPDDPPTVGELAESGARLGMARLALRLCKGYLARWPREHAAVSYGLLAVRLLNGPLDQPAEARVLMAKLMAVYTDQAYQADMHTLNRQLQNSPDPA
jgi:hypothetical protein